MLMVISLGVKIEGKGTACSENSDVDIFQEAAVCQVHRANYIAPDNLLFVVLAPVNVRPSSTSSTVQNMSRLNTSE